MASVFERRRDHYLELAFRLRALARETRFPGARKALIDAIKRITLAAGSTIPLNRTFNSARAPAARRAKCTGLALVDSWMEDHNTVHPSPGWAIAHPGSIFVSNRPRVRGRARSCCHRLIGHPIDRVGLSLRA